MKQAALAFLMGISSSVLWAGGGECMPGEDCTMPPTKPIYSCEVLKTQVYELPTGTHQSFKMARDLQKKWQETKSVLLGGGKYKNKGKTIYSLGTTLWWGSVTGFKPHHPPAELHENPFEIPWARYATELSQNFPNPSDFPLMYFAYMDIFKAPDAELTSFVLSLGLHHSSYKETTEVKALVGQMRCSDYKGE